MADEEQSSKKRSGGILYTDEFAKLLAINENKKPKLTDDCISIGIIGPSSKRNTDFESSATRVLTADLFKDMVSYAIEWIETTFLDSQESPLNWSTIRLVSGGAAWCDHVAVAVYLAKHSLGVKLTLYMPCQMTKAGFFDSGKKWGAITNPGGISNKQHYEFSQVLQISSLNQVLEATKLGATVNTDYAGFFARDKALAHACDELLAFGWSNNGAPDTPGTSRTWKAAPPNVKRHYCSLEKLSLSNTRE